MAQVTLDSIEGKLILTATILASGMAFLDGTVVNIAIPVIQKMFHASLPQIEWMVNGYTLMLASLILISGSLGDRYGRKKIFTYGMALFVLSSLLCSLSQSIDQLTAFRVVQGIGAAMMIPGSLSIINLSFDHAVRGKAIGMWSGFSGGVAALGPFLGGWLVQTLGWPSIFYINIPIGLLAFFLTMRYVPESRNEHAHRVDLFGTVLIFVSMLGISYGLIEAPNFGWANPVVFLSTLIGIVTFFCFVMVEMKVKGPLVPIQIFKSSLVTGANIVTLFLYFALNGVIFFLVLNFQQLQHYSPLFAGMGMLPAILLITFLSGPAGSLSDKIGPRLPMILGPLIVAIGMFLFTFPGKNAHYFTDFMPGLLLFGLGMSLVIAPLTKSALSVPAQFSGAASGVNNAVARFSALLAVALLSLVILSNFSAVLSRTLATSGITPAQQAQIMQQKNKMGVIEVPKAFDMHARDIAKAAVADSFLSSFRIAMSINAFLAFLGVVVAFFTIYNPAKDIKKSNKQ